MKRAIARDVAARQLALLQAFVAHHENLTYALTARNFNPVIAIVIDAGCRDGRGR
jgi:hypothetical protein